MIAHWKRKVFYTWHMMSSGDHFIIIHEGDEEANGENNTKYSTHYIKFVKQQQHIHKNNNKKEEKYIYPYLFANLPLFSLPRVLNRGTLFFAPNTFFWPGQCKSPLFFFLLCRLDRGTLFYAPNKKDKSATEICQHNNDNGVGISWNRSHIIHLGICFNLFHNWYLLEKKTNIKVSTNAFKTKHFGILMFSCWFLDLNRVE